MEFQKTPCQAGYRLHLHTPSSHQAAPACLPATVTGAVLNGVSSRRMIWLRHARRFLRSLLVISFLQALIAVLIVVTVLAECGQVWGTKHEKV